ncbi:MAG TPA: hypothetical protein VFT22_21160 [Kofleriaceae bacterium]|nr:hypothetical protein [Kofleriaceae bacterium]
MRELEGDHELTGDGRKVTDREHVGGSAPDADDGDPERLPPLPDRRDRR